MMGLQPQPSPATLQGQLWLCSFSHIDYSHVCKMMLILPLTLGSFLPISSVFLSVYFWRGCMGRTGHHSVWFTATQTSNRSPRCEWQINIIIWSPIQHTLVGIPWIVTALLSLPPGETLDISHVIIHWLLQPATLILLILAQVQCTCGRARENNAS